MLVALALAAPPAPQEYDPGSGVAPGGYWGPGERPAVAPKDGEEELLSAYILLPLAALTAASGAGGVWLSMPGHCPRRLRYVGYDASLKQCRGFLILNSIRTTYGALGVITGFVLLGIGLHRKKEYELWKKRNFRSRLELGPRGIAAHFRF
jgi:hypothetical protein